MVLMMEKVWKRPLTSSEQIWSIGLYRLLSGFLVVDMWSEIPFALIVERSSKLPAQKTQIGDVRRKRLLVRMEINRCLRLASNIASSALCDTSSEY